MAPYSTSIAIIAAIFLGFFRLSGFWLLPLTCLAVWGMRFYHPEQFGTWFAYARSGVIAFLCLSLFEWVARLASLYIAGYAFIGRIE
jgi:hypothetical protein